MPTSYKTCPPCPAGVVYSLLIGPKTIGLTTLTLSLAHAPNREILPLSKITLQFTVYLTVSNKYNRKLCFLCAFNMSLNTHFCCYTRFLSLLRFTASHRHHGSFSTLSTFPSSSSHNSTPLPLQGSIHCHSGILVLK